MKINKDNYLRQLRLHDEKALVWVIEEYNGLVTAIVRKKLYALPQYHEERISDVFLGVWKNIEYYDEYKNSFQNWIAGIARFKSVDYLRKYLRELQTESIEDVTIAAPDDSYDRIMAKEVSREVEQMLSCLRPKDRELFTKLYVEDKSFEEVSAETGMTKDVIYNRVSRGKKKIRKLFPVREGSGQ